MRDTIDKIFNEIYAVKDTTFSQVKQFTKGGWETTRLMFPFINIGRVEDVVTSQTIGRLGNDESVFTVYIEFGTKHLVPEIAYFGDATTKGLLHIADDLRHFCRGRMFDGAFTRPAAVRRVRTDVINDDADWIFVGELLLEGRRKEKRLQP